MEYEVFLTEHAARDLEDIYGYIAEKDGGLQAGQVLGKIEEAFSNLARYPHRGAMPRELTALGIREYREIFFKPYRIIYRVLEERVFVLLIADGRRSMRTLLERRLLRD